MREADFWVGTHETVGENDGELVRMFQRVIGGATRESWCMSFAQFCIQKVDLLLGNETYSKIPISENCWEVWTRAPDECRLYEPKPGVLAIWNFVGTQKGHCGIVRDWKSPEPNIFYTVEGNTSDSDEIVRNGDGVFRRRRSLTSSNKFNLLGFLDPWP